MKATLTPRMTDPKDAVRATPTRSNWRTWIICGLLGGAFALLMHFLSRW
jgi:hypothetical protein